MNDEKLRVILLTHGGYEEVVDLLVTLKRVELVGIYAETDIVRQYSVREKVKRSIRYDGYLATLVKFFCKAFGIGCQNEYDQAGLEEKQERLRRIAKANDVPIHFVANYHSDEAIALMRAAEADLGVIFGTNILKPSVFKIPRLGSINLHQGRAPYYRGGPPVFWELFNGETEVGITVHYVEPKVDTGEIILQEAVPLIYDYSFGLDFELFISHFLERSRNRCVRMVAEAVRMIADGETTPWPQDADCGRRYRLPVKREKDELRYRLQKRRALTATFPIVQEIGAEEE
jgi:folate-dependent phosphoribosylglycinamide formyltransferase PurN